MVLSNHWKNILSGNAICRLDEGIKFISAFPIRTFEKVCLAQLSLYSSVQIFIVSEFVSPNRTFLSIAVFTITSILSFRFN